MSYFYRGRHRAPTRRGRATATVLSAVAVVPVTSGVAQAQDWDPIIECESGGDPAAQNSSSTASGLFQFIDGTWAAYGGTQYASKAKFASVAEQYEIANRAYAAEGYNPWAASNGCHGLIGTEGSAPAASAPVQRAETKTKTKAPTKAEATVSDSSGTVTVQAGDTLSGIAAVEGTSWQSLYDKNDDVLSSPHLIFPGQVLDT